MSGERPTPVTQKRPVKQQFLQKIPLGEFLKVATLTNRFPAGTTRPSREEAAARTPAAGEEGAGPASELRSPAAGLVRGGEWEPELVGHSRNPGPFGTMRTPLRPGSRAGPARPGGPHVCSQQGRRGESTLSPAQEIDPFQNTLTEDSGCSVGRARDS